MNGVTLTNEGRSRLARASPTVRALVQKPLRPGFEHYGEGAVKGPIGGGGRGE
jgi:hypothetical protein